MSAAVCGKRSSSIFDELPLPYQPHHSAKRSRCGFSPPRDADANANANLNLNLNLNPLLSHLRSLFPQMNQQLLERALEAAGNDLDSAIKSLTDLHLEPEQINLPAATPVNTQEQRILGNDGDICTAADSMPPSGSGGSQWVELFVQEMMNASDMDDARSRATTALQVLEKSTISRASPETTHNVQKENSLLKEHMEVVLRENAILKRAVAIQHDRQKEQVEQNQEVQHLRQMVSQYQEQVRTLEVNNYALMMHLRQAQQGSTIPGRFHPDVF